MRKPLFTVFSAVLGSLIGAGFLSAAPLEKQEEVREFINSRLVHSSIQRITEEGILRIKSPSDSYTVRLKETAFSLNDRNGDARVRMASVEGLESREGETKRQSFVCRNHQEAREVIEALRRLKLRLTRGDETFRHLEKSLNTGDPELTFTNVREGLDFLNDRFLISVVTELDPKGFLFLNGPDENYRVDLRKAEFALNDRSGNPKVRIYGDWCMEYWKHGRPGQALARETFSTDSRREALQVIKTLYALKALYLGQDPAQVGRLHNVHRQPPKDTTTPQGAKEALNERLALSIIQDIDSKGHISINAPEAVYRFDLKNCTFERPQPKGSFNLWLLRTFNVGGETGVTIRSPQGLRRYTTPDSPTTVEEETFSCTSSFEAQEVMEILRGLQQNLK